MCGNPQLLTKILGDKWKTTSLKMFWGTFVVAFHRLFYIPGKSISLSLMYEYNNKLPQNTTITVNEQI